MIYWWQKSLSYLQWPFSQSQTRHIPLRDCLKSTFDARSLLPAYFTISASHVCFYWNGSLSRMMVPSAGWMAMTEHIVTGTTTFLAATQRVIVYSCATRPGYGEMLDVTGQGSSFAKKVSPSRGRWIKSVCCWLQSFIVCLIDQHVFACFGKQCTFLRSTFLPKLVFSCGLVPHDCGISCLSFRKRLYISKQTFQDLCYFWKTSLAMALKPIFCSCLQLSMLQANGMNATGGSGESSKRTGRGWRRRGHVRASVVTLPTLNPANHDLTAPSPWCRRVFGTVLSLTLLTRVWVISLTLMFIAGWATINEQISPSTSLLRPSIITAPYTRRISTMVSSTVRWSIRSYAKDRFVSET